jgi:hypothetical protein
LHERNVREGTKRMTRNEKTTATSAPKTLTDSDLGTVAGGQGEANHSAFAIVKFKDIAPCQSFEN